MGKSLAKWMNEFKGTASLEPKIKSVKIGKNIQQRVFASGHPPNY
jgi:hypothetical protein